MTHTNLTDEELIAKMQESADSYGERWYAFSAWNSQTHYGFGSAQEAERYCEVLNKHREINVYSAAPMAFPDALGLDRGTDDSGFRLDLELDNREAS